MLPPYNPPLYAHLFLTIGTITRFPQSFDQPSPLQIFLEISQNQSFTSFSLFSILHSESHPHLMFSHPLISLSLSLIFSFLFSLLHLSLFPFLISSMLSILTFPNRSLNAFSFLFLYTMIHPYFSFLLSIYYFLYVLF